MLERVLQGQGVLTPGKSKQIRTRWEIQRIRVTKRAGLLPKTYQRWEDGSIYRQWLTPQQVELVTIALRWLVIEAMFKALVGLAGQDDPNIAKLRVEIDRHRDSKGKLGPAVLRLR